MDKASEAEEECSVAPVTFDFKVAVRHFFYCFCRHLICVAFFNDIDSVLGKSAHGKLDIVDRSNPARNFYN